jgi:hypothetical protein
MIYRGPGFLAILWFGSSPPPLPSVSSTGDTQEDWEKKPTWWQKGGGRGRSRIIRPQESLVLFKSFNTLWVGLTLKVYNACQAVGEVSAVYKIYSVRLRSSILGGNRKLSIMKTRRNTLRTEAMWPHASWYYNLTTTIWDIVSRHRSCSFFHSHALELDSHQRSAITFSL